MIPGSRLQVLFLGLLLLSGCALGPSFAPRSDQTLAEETDSKFVPVGEPLQIQPEMLQPPTKPFRLGPGDKIEIELVEVPQTGQVCNLMPDGYLYYHILPGFRAGGMTLAEVQGTLQQRMTQYYKNPQVSVILRGVVSRRVWVLGRVNTPGLYALENPMTVLEAISRAGGLFTSRFSGTTEELADLKHSFLVRQGQFIPVDFQRLLREGDLSQNIYLESGDYLYLPSALSTEVYILGAVRQPRAVGFKDQVTLVSAISAARGTVPGADTGHVVIVRGSLSTPKIAIVDLQSIITGKSPDVPLQPRDIVWVTKGPFERIEKYLRIILNTFVSTVAANEGARAGASGAGNINTSIIIGQ